MEYFIKRFILKKSVDIEIIDILSINYHRSHRKQHKKCIEVSLYNLLKK